MLCSVWLATNLYLWEHTLPSSCHYCALYQINPRLAIHPNHPPDSCYSLLGSPLLLALLVFFDVSTPPLFLPHDPSAPRVRLAYDLRTTCEYYCVYTSCLLLKDPRKRSSATDLLRHPFLAECTIATDTERADMTPEGSETVRSS